VAVLVEHVPLVQHVVVASVFANQTVQADNAVMMVVGLHLAEFVLPLKPVPTEFVSELQLLIVLERYAEPIKPEEVVEVVPRVNVVDLDNANVITIVTKEIVEMQSNLMDPILESVLKNLVELVHLHTIVLLAADALLSLPVQLQSQLLIVIQEEVLGSVVQF